MRDDLDLVIEAALRQPPVIKSVCEYGMNPDDCIRKADTCFKCLKDD